MSVGPLGRVADGHGWTQNSRYLVGRGADAADEVEPEAARAVDAGWRWRSVADLGPVEPGAATCLPAFARRAAASPI